MGSCPSLVGRNPYRCKEISKLQQKNEAPKRLLVLHTPPCPADHCWTFPTLLCVTGKLGPMDGIIKAPLTSTK